MKLPWNEAPEWAEWAAMDSDVQWWWFDAEPELDGLEWYPATLGIEPFKFSPCTNWKISKQRRNA